MRLSLSVRRSYPVLAMFTCCETGRRGVKKNLITFRSDDNKRTLSAPLRALCVSSFDASVRYVSDRSFGEHC